jgi:glycosyltransferase involved in cell wall biosynthesis
MNVRYDVRLGSGSPADIRVLLLTEHVNATYFISFHFAIQQLHDAGRVDVAVMSESRVAEQAQRYAGAEKLARAAFDEVRPDLLVFTRYGDTSGLAFRDAALRSGIPYIYHIDDDLLNLPADLGADVLRKHGSVSVLETRRALLSSADLIYASTPFLQQTLQGYFPDRDVVSGMYAPYLEQPIRTTTSTRKFVIGYMGSKGHAQDLAMIAGPLCEVLSKRPETSFETFGTVSMPAELQRFGSRVRSHKGTVDYQAFLRQLSQMSWNVGLAPLKDSVFNRCKAPTKFVEYTACGIPTMASHINVYEEVAAADRGILLREDDWSDGLLEAVDGQLRLAAVLANARSWCADTFPLQRLENQLLDVFSAARAKRGCGA